MFSTKTPFSVLNRVNYWDVKDFVYICCEKNERKMYGYKATESKPEKSKNNQG